MSDAFVIENDKLVRYQGEDEDVVIPDGVTQIGEKAFSNCRSLKSITIPDGVKTIGRRAFDNCTDLISVSIPQSVTDIREHAFYGCRKLRSVDLPEGITRIDEWTFSGCQSLERVTIPNSVTNIQAFAFHNCYQLSDITIPNGVTIIGDGAFYHCSRLKSVEIPETVVYLGDSSFSDCSGLADENGMTIIRGILYDYSGKEEEVVVPDGVQVIGCHAFHSWDIKRVILPQGLKRISSDAFRCFQLEEITIPDGVEEIGIRAFSGCGYLEKVEIPNSVTCIETNAFEDCDKLRIVRSPLKPVTKDAIFALFLSDNQESSSKSKMRYYAFSSKAYTDNLADFAKPGSWKKYDLELINNGPQYKYRVETRLVGALGRLLEPVELTGGNAVMLKELLTKNIRKMIPVAEAIKCPEMIKALFDLGIVNTQNEKAFRKQLSGSAVPEIKELAGTELAANM